MDVKDRLKEMDGQHRPEEVPDMGSKVPDGTYQVRLDKMYITESKSSGRLQTVLEFEVIAGTYAFRRVWKYAGMETVEQLDYLTNDLRRLGIEHFTWSTVETQFIKVVDKVYEIKLQTKGEFQNLYIVRALKNEDFASDVAKGNDPDDDVPF